MNMIPITTSSQVSALGYNPDTLKLRFRFKPFANKNATKPQPEPPVYEYSNVSQADYDAIFNAESIGREINQRLKSNPQHYPYWFGLPTPWGKLNLDIFPPRIWNMDQPEATK